MNQLEKYHRPSVRKTREDAVAGWVQKLAVGLLLPRAMDELSSEGKRAYLAELTTDLIAENLPDAVWSPDALRYVKKRHKFFPTLCEICEDLHQFVAPIQAIQKKKQIVETDKKLGITPYNETLSRHDASWLRHYRENESDGFVALAERRGTNPQEARRSNLSLLRAQAPAAYETLADWEK